MQRWKKIAISSCQQCKRNVVPIIKDPIDIFKWCEKKYDDTKLIFHPEAILTISQLKTFKKHIRILIGAEIGFTDYEIKKIISYKFMTITLGPRILRTETAGLVAITALQMQFGDLK